mmetsp:Transcript_13401/g.37052  ORF Transcript_13401/g.37052 Transcript_13401/m.37052 type:complete len:252 (-) Transcript_13401:132-887(-)
MEALLVLDVMITISHRHDHRHHVCHHRRTECKSEGSRQARLEEWLSGDPVVVDHATDGEHGQSSVLDLLQLHLGHLLVGLANGQTHWVEPEVAWLPCWILEHGLHGDVALVGPEFQNTHPQDDLEHGGGTDDGWREVGVVDVGVSWDGHPLLRDESEACEHGGASVLDLGLAQPLHVEVVGETERVEADIADVSLEVLWVHDEWKGLGHLSVELGGGKSASWSLRDEGGGASDEGGEEGDVLHGDRLVWFI